MQIELCDSINVVYVTAHTYNFTYKRKRKKRAHGYHNFYEYTKKMNIYEPEATVSNVLILFVEDLFYQYFSPINPPT